MNATARVKVLSVPAIHNTPPPSYYDINSRISALHTVIIIIVDGSQLHLRSEAKSILRLEKTSRVGEKMSFMMDWSKSRFEYILQLTI